MLATEIALEWLRPWWLLALLPMALLLWRAWQTKAKQGAWHKVIDPKFQPLLLGSAQGPQFTLSHKLGLMSLGLVWSLLILILAGPTFKAVEIPAQKSQKATVIVLDLSLSMLADDLTPNRLSQVKFKITDLIKANPQESIGLVAYANTAHTITPISEDNQTLLGLLPALSPLIMPEYGSNPLSGMQKAKTLFEGAHITQGHILWIADDIEPEQVSEISRFFKTNDYSLSILIAGTPQGGLVQIPNYGVLKDELEQVVLPHVPAERFAQLGQQLNAPVISLKIEDNHLQPLFATQTASKALDDKQTPKSVLHPLDQGAALLLILVPLIALIYRRGWLFSWLLVGLLPAGLLSYSDSSWALEKSSRWDELGNMFQTHDQQAYKAWNKENYEAAEALFENPQWQASALYRLGKYTEAAKLFARDKSPKGLYNLGNALAKSGDLQGAKQAYEKALHANPNFTEAKQNLDIVNQLLKQLEQLKPQASNDNTSENTNEQTNANGSNNQSKPETGKQNLESAKTPDNDQTPSQTSNNDGNPTEQNPSHSASSSANNQQNAEDTNPNGQANHKVNNQSDNQTAKPQADQNTGDATEYTTPSNEAKNTLNLFSNSESNTYSEPTEPPHTPSQLGNWNANNSENSLLESPQEQEKRLATDTWMQQIPDTPGVFLQRKFAYQYQQLNTTQSTTQKSHPNSNLNPQTRTKSW